MHIVCVPAGHPAENLRGSFLPGACQEDGCAGSPGSQCRCPEPETEPCGPHVERVTPSCDSTAAVAPTHNFFPLLWDHLTTAAYTFIFSEIVLQNDPSF